MRKLIPQLSIKDPATSFRRAPAPLFKEERDPCSDALVADINHPFQFHWPSTWTALTANDDPMNVVKAQPANRSKKGLYRKEPHSGPCSLQVHDTRCGLIIFDRNAKPNMRRCPTASVAVV